MLHSERMDEQSGDDDDDALLHNISCIFWQKLP
jgi:hypothetical protein